MDLGRTLSACLISPWQACADTPPLPPPPHLPPEISWHPPETAIRLMESRNFSPRCREAFSRPGKRKQRKCPKAQEKAWEEGNADAAFPVIFLYRFRWMLAVVCYCCTTQWARLSMDLQTRLAINKTGHLIAWIGSCRRPQSQHATLSGLREDLLFCPRLRPSVIMSAADDLVLFWEGF